VEAIRNQLDGRIRAAAPIENNYDTIVFNGKEEDVLVIGSDESYQPVRNLLVLAGRFLDNSDVALRQHVALLTDKLAARLYGGQANALGQLIKVHGLQFTVIGTFREKVESFGQSELNKETILIPISVQQYFIRVERIDPLYVQVRSPDDVESVTQQVQSILESRHRPGAKYKVENLRAILSAAKSIALVLTLVLILVSAIALVISGIGIMNIMLVSVTERTREIGVRKAIGARKNDIIKQFLIEAVVLSELGGVAGILTGVLGGNGVAVAFDMSMVFPWGWAVTALIVCSLIGTGFGLYPAWKAASLHPIEALRFE
jgi:putative ABC transport system permease protein